MSKLVINTKDFGGYKKFNSIIKKRFPFIHVSCSRTNLHGIYFEFKQHETILTASDGQVLYTESFGVKNEVVGKAIINIEGLKQLVRMNQEYFLEIEKIYSGERFVTLNGHNYSWIVNADYVNYERAIPSLEKNNTVIEYVKEDLNHKILKEANLRMRESLIEQEIDCLRNHKTTTVAKEGFKSKYNIYYINCIMDALDDKNIIFNIDCNAPESSVLFCENNKRILLMPDRF